ncbi:MAG: oligopeptide/dipeptide ABC transporter ATP-binding protein, partial [Acidimicrobiales bacterium]
GCGKSTTGRAIMQLPAPTGGRVLFEGSDLASLSGQQLREVRTRLQFIFQDPISSLNPRRKVKDIVAEPLRIWKRGSDAEQTARVAEVLDAVGLDPAVSADKRPHQFSGGQCQRISIARSLVLEPKVIICDEPVSALDVSVQAQILNLLEDMKARYGLTLIFIAHDLAVVKNISDRVAVMYLGKICEVGNPDALYATPAHPYTAALLRSIPVPDPTVPPVQSGLITGDLPSPIDPPAGCRFRTRCPLAQERCAIEEPVIREVADGQFVACHFPLVGPVAPEGTPVEAGATTS